MTIKLLKYIVLIFFFITYKISFTIPIWYVIGAKNEFNNNQKKITIKNKNFIIWKYNNSYYGLKDCCTHQGSSFVNGKIHKNTITCPYHGYIFNGTDGNLLHIPGVKNKLLINNSQINSYLVKESGDYLFLNYNSNNNSDIWIEKEYFNNSFTNQLLTETFEHNAKYVTINSLDVCHISVVHSFGNKKNPLPINSSEIIKINDTEHHYKVIYNYKAGENSIVKKIFNVDDIIIENEYILPHTSVARVIFNNMISTVVTRAQPITEFKTKLYVSVYRNFWINQINDNIILNEINKILKMIGDIITMNSMKRTLNEDKIIISNIDKLNKNDAEGYFDFEYDKLSRHYKDNYKKYINRK